MRKSNVVLGISALSGGLSNQRLAMLGLLSKSIERQVQCRFPSEMLDFVPRRTSGVPSRFFFPDLFDLAEFRLITSKFDVCGELPTELIPFSKLLPIGSSLYFGPSTPDWAKEFLKALVASKRLRDTVAQVRDKLQGKRVVPLQLRIERDWQDYMSRATVNPNEDNTVDPLAIFQRMRNTTDLDCYNAIWACCDEDDLSVSKEEIKSMGRKLDFNVIFKSDLARHVEFPQLLLMRAMVDYTFCAQSTSYVGLTRSTFSRCLAREAMWQNSGTDCFYYNLDRTSIVRAKEV